MELRSALRMFQAKQHSKLHTNSTYQSYYSIGVYVGAGSRDETLQTTGTSYLLQRLATRGTTTKSKSQITEEIEGMGARYSAHSDREFTKYGLQIFGQDTNRAVSLLGDLISNQAYNSAEFEIVKEEVS